MLSKLRHAEATDGAISLNEKRLSADLNALFAGRLDNLQPVPGGTLGICFVGSLSGQRRFFKTHLLPAGKEALEREVAFLDKVVGVRTDALLAHSMIEGEVRTWLHMKMLRQSAGLMPSSVRRLIADYEVALQDFPRAALVQKNDNIGLLHFEAELGLKMLVSKRLISFDVKSHVARCLGRIRSNFEAWPMQLCHGDLGPANIMADEQGPLAIDWEDAFWGVAGYDYLYWLTFFSNRPWLSRDALGHTQLGRANEVALMVMILVLKSALSVRNGSYRSNSVSFDQRLCEVICLD